MKHSKGDWDDVVSSVRLEMERMFAILDRQYPRKRCNKAVIVAKIETALKKTLKTITPPALPDTPPPHVVDQRSEGIKQAEYAERPGN